MSKEHHSEICAKLNDIYVKKNMDYGSSFDKSMDRFGPISAIIRMEDKINRLESLLMSAKRPSVIDESMLDTLYDLANYAILTILKMESDEDDARYRERDEC